MSNAPTSFEMTPFELASASHSPAPSAAAPLPDAFFKNVLAQNPFILNRATADGGDGHDVTQIHSDLFLRLTELAGEAVRLRRGLGVLLTGEAGSGKSHILGRLARWAAVGHRATFVLVRGLQTDPELLPAAVMRSAGAALAGRPGPPAKTPLYRLAHAAARTAVADDGGHHAWERVGRAFAKLADQLAPSARRVPEGRSAFDLVFRFFRSAARAAEGREDGASAELALRWLTGGVLDADEARSLNLPPPAHQNDGVTLTDSEWARQGLTALAVLAVAAGRPFVLVTDQAEELDGPRFAALARFLEGLLDNAPGLLAVTSADNAAVRRWRDRGEAPASAWDRLAQFTLQPARLKPSEAAALLRRRLDDALAPFKDLEFLYHLRAGAPLFPLHPGLDSTGMRAREVLDSAREAWVVEQDVLRKQGGADWLAGWAERMAPPTADGSAGQDPGESSLTYQQVQAAIAVRAAARVRPPDPPPTAAPPAPPAAGVAAPAEPAVLPEAPTVPDPNAARPRRGPEAAPRPDPERAFAPSARRLVLAPRPALGPAAPPTPHDEAVDRAVAAAFAADLAGRVPRAEVPADAEQVADLILNLLLQCRAADPGYGVLQVERVTAGKAACDLVVRQQAEGGDSLRTGVLVLTASRATAMAGYLRRLATETQPFDRLFLITEERVGLPLGPRGQEYLQELAQRSSVLLHTLELAASGHAELSALRAVVRQARDGTLTADGAPVTEEDVIASHHRQRRYAASALLAALLFDSPASELKCRPATLTP